MADKIRLENNPFLREAWTIGYTHIVEDKVKNEIIFYSEVKTKRFDYFEFISFISGLKLIRTILWDGSRYDWVSDANGDGYKFRNYLLS